MTEPYFHGMDGVGRPVVLPRLPIRIVSLVPSQTEMLIDFGLADRVVGRTRYCIHPSSVVSRIEIVGGTKQVDFEKIRSLKPDLILAEKEENPLELVEAASVIAPVYVTDVVSIESALGMMKEVGRVLGVSDRAIDCCDKISQGLLETHHLAQGKKALYLIWKKPFMAAGRDTFISDCLRHLGFENVGISAFGTARYPEFTLDGIVELNPDWIFLSSEPFPFRESHLEELREQLRGRFSGRLALVDGEFFSWYGTRMEKMPNYWKTWWSLLEHSTIPTRSDP